jgi:5'-methylthioadenosine nucleosidase
LNLIWPGKDPSFGVDSVGTISSALVTYAAIQSLKPDLIINAGTAGGFKARGATVGDIFIASHSAFHDRRIPIPVSLNPLSGFAFYSILYPSDWEVGDPNTDC